MSDKKQTVDLGLLEEDDEFEEFPAEGEQCWSQTAPVLFFHAGPRSRDSASLAMSVSIGEQIHSLLAHIC